MFGHRNGKGAVVVDGVHAADTLTCVHCQYTWEVIPGSGIRRGWCNNCKGAVCGKESCMKHCTPFEARLELTEAAGRGNAKEMKRIMERYPGIKIL